MPKKRYTNRVDGNVSLSETLKGRVEREHDYITPKGGKVHQNLKDSSMSDKLGYTKPLTREQRDGRDAYERAAIEGKKLPTSTTKKVAGKVIVSNLNRYNNSKKKK